MTEEERKRGANFEVVETKKKKDMITINRWGERGGGGRGRGSEGKEKKTYESEDQMELL